jgi:hypothetical protein
MQHKCPMCGCSYSSHYIRRADQVRFLISLGTDWIWHEGRLAWTTWNAIEQLKDALLCPLLPPSKPALQSTKEQK